MHFISAKQFLNMQELQKKILNRTKSLLTEKILIPIFYKKVANEISQLKDIDQKILCYRDEVLAVRRYDAGGETLGRSPAF